MRRAPVPLVLVLLLLAAPARGPANAQDHPPGAPRPTVALVLSGGAARGAAHVGVIQELVAAGVPIDVVTGSSIGAIVGGLYAAGFAADELAQLLRFADPTSAARLQLPLRGGVLDTEPLRRLLAALLEDRLVRDTHIPFRALVTDLETGEAYAPEDVPLALALQASAAVPILFNPVRIGERHYVDGGFRQVIPAETALALGADYLIAVDTTHQRPLDPDALPSVAASTLGGLMRPYTEASLRLVDVVIRPKVRQETYLDFVHTEAYVAAGRLAAREHLPAILADLRARGIPLHADGDPNRDHPINAGWRERLALGGAHWDPRALRLDAGLDASAALVHDPDALSDRFAIGLALGGGDLRRGSIGVVLERGSEPATNALTLRLGYHALDTVELFATTTTRLERDTSLRLGVRWRPLPEVELAAAHDLLTGLSDARAGIRADHLWLEGSAQARLGAWWRAGIDARAAVGAPEAGPGSPELGVRGFAVVASPSTPAAHAVRVTPAWFRAAGPTAVTHALTGGSLELRTTVGQPVWLGDVVELTTRARAFLDLVHHDARTRAGVGAGITFEGSVAGFLPFALRLDLAVDLSNANLRLILRTGPDGPRPWRPVAAP